jgi:hypothetical protein
MDVSKNTSHENLKKTVVCDLLRHEMQIIQERPGKNPHHRDKAGSEKAAV